MIQSARIIFSHAPSESFYTRIAAQTALVAGFEPSGNLFGRPSFRKTIADKSPQFLIFFEDGFTPPAQLIGSGGVKRRITPAREGVASQFPRHGELRGTICAMVAAGSMPELRQLWMITVRISGASGT